MAPRNIMKGLNKKLNKPKGGKIVTGIAWYRSDQWADLRRVVSDPAELKSTYEEWQAVVKRSVPDLINAGMNPVKVPVDVTELVSWCRQRGKPVDADARAQYVVELLQQRGASSFEAITNKFKGRQSSAWSIEKHDFSVVDFKARKSTRRLIQSYADVQISKWRDKIPMAWTSNSSARSGTFSLLRWVAA